MSTNRLSTNPTGGYISSAMNKVYNYMFAAIIMTGIVAYIISNMPQLQAILLSNPLKWVVIFAPLACVLLMSFKFDKLSTTTLALLFGLVSLAFGMSLSTIFLVYTGGTIVAALFSSSVIFLVMSVYGHVTKRDLSTWRQFLFIGIIGLILSQIVNLFLQSGPFSMALSALAVIIFTLFTAYDTQRIKLMMQSSDSSNVNRLAIMGALSLYINFINLFANLLNLFGGRR